MAIVNDPEEPIVRDDRLPASVMPLTSKMRRRIAASILARRGEILSEWWDSQFDEGRIRRYAVEGVDGRDKDTLVRTFLDPLLNLLIGYVRTGEDRYQDAYLDERLRYAPHRASPLVRVRFFDEVLPADEAAIIGASQLPSELPSALWAVLTEVHAPLRSAPSQSPLRFLTLGDCLMTELRVSLTGLCRRIGIDLDMRALYFSALTGRGLCVDQVVGFLKEFPADLIALSFLSFEGIPFYRPLLREAGRLAPAQLAERVAAIMALIGEFLGRLREHTDAPFLIHNAGGLPLNRLRRYFPFLPSHSKGSTRALRALNDALSELAVNTPNTLLIDEVAVVRTKGHHACAAPMIPRGIARNAYFHTSMFGKYLSEHYIDILQSYKTLGRAKVLLVDFDDTLWEGVMADGPVKHRHDLQSLLRRVKEAGILLVAVSKNEPAHVRWDEMTLQPSDFILHKIGWDLKVQSISDAARELNLGLDSFVFLDDNPVERELVQRQFPMICALEPTCPSCARWLERMVQFPNTRDTEEARTRTEMYRQQSVRQKALRQRFEYPSMMADLGLAVCFRCATRGDLDRVAELIQRTNQFNTTTIRYSKQELRTILDGGRHAVYVATLSDKFGSAGMVCVAIIERKGNDRVFDSFVMSCRAMGFELERLMLRLVIDSESSDATRFVGRFHPTDRNTPCKDLFSSNGFSRWDAREWVLEPDATRPEKPVWFKTIAD
jgi:FkbH-like protein